MVRGCTSGLLVKVLACNQKVAGSSPTRCRLFFAHEYTQLLSQNEEVFITTSFRGDVKPATCAIPATSVGLFLDVTTRGITSLRLRKLILGFIIIRVGCSFLFIERSFLFIVAMVTSRNFPH